MKHQQKLQITYSNVGKYKHIKYSHFKKTVFCIRQNTVFVFFTYLFHRFTGLLRYRFTNTNATTSTTKHTPYKTTFPITDEYYGAAEPPVRCGESHLSGLTEPPIDSYSA